MLFWNPMKPKKRRLRARLCSPPICTRITLRDRCERCSRIPGTLKRAA